MVSRAFVYNEDYTIWSDHLDRNLLTKARNAREIKCHCGKALTFVDSTFRIPHFRHRQGNCRIICVERDTETHNEGLEYLGQLLRRTLGAVVEKERTFRVAGGLRRTDIFVKLKSGETICYELQCSPISESEFKDRTATYQELGHRVLWIFGPDASGIPPREKNSASMIDGVLTGLRRPAFLALRSDQHVSLYWPTTEHRLRIGYCVDGRFNRTRDIPLRETQYAYPMPEVNLGIFPLEFGSDGLPYIENFIGISKKSEGELPAKKMNKLHSLYEREILRHGLLTRKLTQLRSHMIQEKAKKEPKKSLSRTTYENRRKRSEKKLKLICVQCAARIVDQHYHICNRCRNVICDRCTLRIENDLNEASHNVTGAVRHCRWKALR